MYKYNIPNINTSRGNKHLLFRAGLYFDVRFGFGLLNAGALVTMALNWTSVPNKHVCRVDAAP